MKAGAPAISGYIQTYENKFEAAIGPFYLNGSAGNNNYHTNGGGKSTWRIYFDASRVSSVYGSSTSITPKSRKILFLMKY